MNNQLDFNKLAFVHCEDQVYKTTLMFTKYGSVSNSVLDYLFFGQEDSICGDINYLEMLEQHNELYAYMNDWLKNLSNIETPSDWNFHRSRMYTRMKKMSYIKESEQIFNKINDKSIVGALKNSFILWNNVVYSIDKINPVNRDDSKMILWRKLTQINFGNYDNISLDQKELRLFDGIIKNREIDSFMVKNKIINKEDVKIINSIKQKMLKIYNKNILEKSLDSADKEKIKKIKI